MTNISFSEQNYSLHLQTAQEQRLVAEIEALQAELMPLERQRQKVRDEVMFTHVLPHSARERPIKENYLWENEPLS